jgi:hypothetical protein
VDFPTTPGAPDITQNGGDAFVASLNPTGSTLVYSTFLGGSNNDEGFAIAVDASGAAYITGVTTSANFPTTAGAFDTSFNGDSDAFVVKISGETETPPTTVTLAPLDAVNTVGTGHTVTATVKNAAGGPSPGVKVLFSVQGATVTTGSCTTDSVGKCSFTYQGPQLPGADIIKGCVDTDNSGTADVNEPCGTATKAWVLPATTPGQVTGGGQIPNAAGNDQNAFGFNAKSDQSGVKGNCNLVDPSTNTKVKCLEVTSLVQTGTHATLFGTAEINGVATTFRIDVDDLAEPGRNQDTFRIQTASGYTAGGVLIQGNIQIHK